MSCCPPWILCQICGEEFPIHLIEDQICDNCRKELKEKQDDRVNN